MAGPANCLCVLLADWDLLAELGSRGNQVSNESWEALTSGGSPFENAFADQDFWWEDFDPWFPLSTLPVARPLLAALCVPAWAVFTLGMGAYAVL
ncbi:hypothetical protein [Halioglobus japonicus]|uniref:Uncharacterized protein n=1 Tax=Halioglobus japonicus TaxID=930805 RepID=A0AAP8SN45_9GAMM|nr:hypothetical protein [Halioglobus japonicus]PLW85698.1 hypothetical protein C0029_13910 [Halioglobus japonicus]